ncbi:MAG TPA: HPF/RaiA family ribosome-associated protein [Myxococcales bacterium]
MKILIRSRIRASAAVRAYVERRLQFSLGRFSKRVDRAVVHLEDVNGPRGGEDKLCRIEVRLRPTGNVLVEESGSLVLAAVAGAAERVGRAVSRAVERRRDMDRARPGWTPMLRRCAAPPARRRSRRAPLLPGGAR